MAWHAGSWQTIPVWPTVFMGLIIVFLVYAQNTVPPISMGVFAGYFVGGIAWFVAIAMSSSVVITEYGLIPQAGRTSDAVGWGQISDYFEVQDGKRIHFTFLYQDFVGQRKRLDLLIPEPVADRFRALVRSKLDVAMNYPPEHIAQGVFTTLGDHSIQGVTSRKALEN